MTHSRAPFVLRLLAVLALLLALVLDIGLMPARAADGQQILVLCSGSGPMQLVLDPVTGKFSPADPARNSAGGCDWAAAHGCGLIPGRASSAQILETRYETAFSGDVVWLVARKVTAVWARGPPVSL